MSEFTPQTLLVTGGAGFIGSNFVRYLLAADPQVRIVNLDLLTYAGSLENLEALPDPERHRFVQGDICDSGLVEDLLAGEEIDTIVHFAADSHVDRSITGPAPFIQTNIVGTFTLLEAARKAWMNTPSPDTKYRFHHISTDEVYGSLTANDPAFSEVTRYAPRSPYSASKAASDHLVCAYNHTYGLPVTITNCSNNYGPYQHSEKMIPTVISSCLRRKSIPVYGDGSNIRDWLYVEDHCRAIDTVIRRGAIGESYNVGGKNEWPNLELVHGICRILDEQRPQGAPHADLITFVKDRPGHDWRYAIDSRKIEEQLQWFPAETFDSGLRKTAAWYCRRFVETGGKL